MSFIYEKAVDAQFLKGYDIIFFVFGRQTRKTLFQTAFCFFKLFDRIM